MRIVLYFAFFLGGCVLLAGCTQPISPDRMCTDALRGVPGYPKDRERMFYRCRDDVYHAAKTAGYNAAKPYRDLPR